MTMWFKNNGSRVVLFLLTLLFLVGGCDTPYTFAPVTNENTSLNQTVDAGVNTGTVVERRGTLLNLPEEHNSYICACKALVPVGCIHFECGLVGTGTSPTGDGYCDLGIRESRICFSRPLITVEEVQADCVDRVRPTVMLGLRWAFRTCREGSNLCSIRLVCTTFDSTRRVRTTRTDRCVGSNCWDTPLFSDLSNVRTATYVPRSMQLLCGGEEMQLSSAQQNVCGEVDF